MQPDQPEQFMSPPNVLGNKMVLQAFLKAANEGIFHIFSSKPFKRAGPSTEKVRDLTVGRETILRESTTREKAV